ncbi:MAG: hypothetical protein AAF551_12280, partial [Bacteroidota bacterium]
KKAVMLLKSLIFHYHGLDDDERKLLEESAQKLNATEEMEWANQFISEDYISAFERSREFLQKIFIQMPVKKRVNHLLDVWNDNYFKGYLTEMETTGILTLSKDWLVEKDFLETLKD